VLQPLVGVADRVVVGVVAADDHRQGVVGRRDGRHDHHRVDDRGRVIHHDGGRGDGGAADAGGGGRHPDGDPVVPVAVARLAQIERGAGGAGEGGAVLEPLVGVGDGVAVVVVAGDGGRHRVVGPGGARRDRDRVDDRGGVLDGHGGGGHG